MLRPSLHPALIENALACFVSVPGASRLLHTGTERQGPAAGDGAAPRSSSSARRRTAAPAPEKQQPAEAGPADLGSARGSAPLASSKAATSPGRARASPPQCVTARPGPLLRASFHGNLPREWWADGARAAAAAGPVTWESLVQTSPTMRLLFPHKGWIGTPPGGAGNSSCGARSGGHTSCWAQPAAPVPGAPNLLARRLSGPLPACPRARYALLRSRLAAAPGERAHVRRRVRPWGAWALQPGGGNGSSGTAPAAAAMEASSCGGSSCGGTAGSSCSAAPSQPAPRDDFASLFPQQQKQQQDQQCSGARRPLLGPGRVRATTSIMTSSDPSPSSGAPVGHPTPAGRPAGLIGAAAEAAAWGAGAWGAAVWCDLPAGVLPWPPPPMAALGAAAPALTAVGVSVVDGSSGAFADGVDGRGYDDSGLTGDEGEEEEDESWVFDAEGDEGLSDDASDEEGEEAWAASREECEAEAESRGGGGGGAPVFMSPSGVVFGFWRVTPLG